LHATTNGVDRQRRCRQANVAQRNLNRRVIVAFQLKNIRALNLSSGSVTDLSPLVRQLASIAARVEATHRRFYEAAEAISTEPSQIVKLRDV
jgi:predicted lipase